MEEMLKKFYEEYKRCYTRYLEVSEMYDIDPSDVYRSAITRNHAKVRELRKVAEIFSINIQPLEDIENDLWKQEHNSNQI